MDQSILVFIVHMRDLSSPIISNTSSFCLMFCPADFLHSSPRMGPVNGAIKMGVYVTMVLPSVVCFFLLTHRQRN